MAGMTHDEGRGRRLPQWMLGINALDKVKMATDGDDKSFLKGLTSQVCQPKAEAETRKPEKVVRPGKKSRSLSKCEAKRRKRKSIVQDVDHDDVIATAVEKKNYSNVGRKVHETASLERKASKKRLRTERKEELDIPSPSDDDVELTVEDLISIAEEYVQADKEKEQQRPSSRACKSERHLSFTTSSGIGFGGSLDAPSDKASSCSTETLMSVRAATETSITGDPTKDMLDLLLGPLLKKPLEEEKRAEFKAIDHAYSYNLEKQHPSDRVGEGMVPFIKKKSSLRDKIAMFLD